MIHRNLGKHKTNWHIMLFLELWDYYTSTKTTIEFTPFQLVYGLEALLPIEYEILSLKLTVELFPNTSTEEERLLYLAHINATLANEAHKKHVKYQYDKSIHPRVFLEGDLVLVYDQTMTH
jgi:hypothetical protein